MPPVILKGTQNHPHLANDLRPHVERFISIPPCLERQRRPLFSRFSVAHFAYFLHVLLGQVVCSLLLYFIIGNIQKV